MNQIPFKEAFLFWLKLGFISFGGPAGQIAIMHQYLVEKKRWLSESAFLHALNYCMLLPGPEALQLATYSGWLMHGTLGGIVAGLLFILPSVFILMGLCVVYVTYGDTAFVSGVFYGIKPAVVTIVILAVWKIGERALKRRIDLFLAVSSLLALLIFKVPYTLVMLASIIFGVVYIKIIDKPTVSKTQDAFLVEDKKDVISRTSRVGKAFDWRNFVLQAFLFFLIWAVPFVLFSVLIADAGFWNKFSLFFTQAALFTFGGAYSVLTYVAQYAVEQLHWLSRSEMIDGLALGETTPGPLMMVLPYAGFMGAYHYFHGSIILGCVGLLISTYFTFLPSFVFILLGAPIVERTQDNQTVKLALSFVTATVVGVLANLAFFTARAVLFPLVVSLSGLNWFALAWILISLIVIRIFNFNMIGWIVLSALVGLVVSLAS